MKLTQEQVQKEVEDFVYQAKESLVDCDRNDLIDEIDRYCDGELWPYLVKQGRLDQYGLNDLIDTLPACATIIEAAEQEGCIADDSGLWEDMTYGVVPCIAYYSLRNLLYNALKEDGVDSNEENPFEKYCQALQIVKDYAERLIATEDWDAFEEAFDSRDANFDMLTLSYEQLDEIVQYCEENCCNQCRTRLVPRMVNNDFNPHDKSLTETWVCPKCDK